MNSMKNLIYSQNYYYLLLHCYYYDSNGEDSNLPLYYLTITPTT